MYNKKDFFVFYTLCLLSTVLFLFLLPQYKPASFIFWFLYYIITSIISKKYAVEKYNEEQ